MLGLLQAIVSSPEVVSAPEQASLLRLLPIALIGGIFEGLSLSGFLNNSQNSIFFGLREIYVSIVVRDVDDDIERVRHVSSLSGNRWLMSAFPRIADIVDRPGRVQGRRKNIWRAKGKRSHDTDGGVGGYRLPATLLRRMQPSTRLVGLDRTAFFSRPSCAGSAPRELSQKSKVAHVA